ncbi:MAG: TolC family protein [Planctomycetota bacterium]
MVPRRAALVALLSALTACVQYEARPLDPDAERAAIAGRMRPAELPALPPSGDPETFPLASTVDATDGLGLDEANALALTHAPALVAARSELRLRGAELLRAGLLENPELFLGPRIDTSGGGLIFPASLRLAIPLGGRLDAEEDRAEAEIEAARRKLLVAEAEVLIDVRRRYIALASLARRREILSRTVAATEYALEKTRQLAAAGEVDQVALGLAIMHRDDAEHELHELDVEATEARVALMTEIGLIPDATVAIIADRAILAERDLPAAENARLVRHPRLRALESAYLAREHGLEVEIAEQYPRLAIGPEFESDDGATSVGLGVSLELPIFDGNAGGIAVARERREAARAAWGHAMTELARAAELARVHHAHARSDLVELRESALPAAEATERALDQRLERGEASLVELLAAQDAIARTRLREVRLEQAAALQWLEAMWNGGRLLVDDAPSEEAR